jgi:hypothetical protein
MLLHERFSAFTAAGMAPVCGLQLGFWVTAVQTVRTHHALSLLAISA